MARDFLSDQIRTKNLIGSGSSPNPKLVVYSDTDAPDNNGTLPANLLDNVGSDVFLFVSGTINGKADAVDKSTTLFGGDVIVSGTLYAEKQIIEVDVSQTGSLSVSGSITHSGGINIGEPSPDDATDNTYTDGLFTDFTPETMLGTVVDRFNEVLAGLAPNPASNLDDAYALRLDQSPGLDAYLSFGVSNDQTSAGYNNVVADYNGETLGYNAFDVNGLYTNTTSVTANNRRHFKLGVHRKNTHFGGALNNNKTGDVYSNGTVNFPDSSFSDGDKGSLALYLNGSQIHSIDLSDPLIGSGDPGSGSGIDLNSNGSGFKNISIVSPAKFSSGQTFSLFKHRTANWFLDPLDQVNGFNFVQVKHEISGQSDRVTGFAQWVNDSNAEALSIASKNLTLNLSGTKHLSGVNYFTGGDLVYTADIDNFYKYVYGVSPVTFSAISVPSGTSFTLPDFTPTSINTGGGEDHTKTLVITSTSSSFTLPSDNRIITDNNSGITINALVTHPYKTLTQTLLNESENGILIDNTSQSSTVINEYFDDEAFRMISKSSPAYDLQSDVSDSANHWVSTETITNGNSGYSDGLLIHNGKLQSTKNDNLVNSGNFSTLNNGPASNPDYSNGNIASGTKKYIRRFTNTGSAVRDISYVIQGSGNIRSHSYTLGSDNDNFKLYFKIPGNTAWLDAASDFSYNSVGADGNGGKIGSFTQSISSNPTNYLTFGTAEVNSSENILVKIESNKTWKGSIDDLLLTFGAVGNVLSSPDVSQIDVNDSGVTGKLSYGASLPKSGYNSVLTLGGSTAADVNSSYNITSYSGNIRRGIFDGNQTIDGEINENVTSSGNNYPNNAWGSGQANVGELKLEVNGSIIRTIDLSTFGSGNSINSNNTGFIGITAATVGADENNLPDYRKFYRTGSFQVSPADQRNGWNYIRVIHDLDGGTTVHTTNYAEWVNNDYNNISIQTNSNIEVDVWNSISSGATPSNYLSGINYFTSATGEFTQTILGAYKYVYSDSNSAISYPIKQNISVSSISVSGSGVLNDTVNSSSRNLPDLDTGVATAAEEDIQVTANFNYSTAVSLPGSLTNTSIRISVLHPTNNTTGTQVSLTKPLIYTVNDTESALVENFSAESYRLQNGTYANQADINSGTWDSQQSLIGTSATHNDGLQVYNSSLVYPTQNFSDNFVLKFKGPTNNPNYSTASSDRAFYRAFENTTASSKFGFQIKIKGSNATIVPNTTPLTGNNIHVFVKLPNTSNTQTTGFMDLALAFNTGQTADNDGCLQGSLSPTVINTGTGTSNNITFGTVFASPSDSVVVKIVAGPTWSGDINRIEVVWS
jgi:hypothetical protein